MKGLCKRAGIETCFAFHTLRHLMASLLADNPKVTTKKIQKILGHSQARTTEIYVHSLDGRIENAMESFSGKFIPEKTRKSANPQPTPAIQIKKGHQ